MASDDRFQPLVDRFGKEIKVDGVRWADCTSDERADIIARALENFFRQPSLPLVDKLVLGEDRIDKRTFRDI